MVAGHAEGSLIGIGCGWWTCLISGGLQGKMVLAFDRIIRMSSLRKLLFNATPLPLFPGDLCRQFKVEKIVKKYITVRFRI